MDVSLKVSVVSMHVGCYKESDRSKKLLNASRFKQNLTAIIKLGYLCPERTYNYVDLESLEMTGHNLEFDSKRF
jgi:hypothetical protein